MPNTIPSANMSMPVPVVGVAPGPDWATDINSCLSILDSHTHASGSGVQITPNGLNISSDLSFLGNNATFLRSTRFSAQVSPLAGPLDLGCLYVSGVDLYYNDESGNQIRITQSGSVAGAAGTITGLPSGTASASYNSGSSTFVFQSATNTAANLDGRSLRLRNSTVSSSALTLSPPNAMGADYALVLPNLPASQSFMTLDSGGNMAAPWTVDNSSLYVSSNLLQIKPLGITTGLYAPLSVDAAAIAANAVTTAKILDSNVTRPKLVAVGQQISSSCGLNAQATGTAAVDITNLSVSFTSTGRPIVIFLQPDGSGNNAVITPSWGGTNQSTTLYLIRGFSTEVARWFYNQVDGLSIQPFYFMDTPAAGLVSYRVACSNSSVVTSVSFNYMKLVAYEL